MARICWKIILGFKCESSTTDLAFKVSNSSIRILVLSDLYLTILYKKICVMLYTHE